MKTIEQVIKEKYPHSDVRVLTDSHWDRTKSLPNVRKAAPVRSRQAAALAKGEGVVKRYSTSKRKIYRKAAKAKGPTGVVMVEPKNTDGLGARRNAKAVIVSNGKIIAVQG